MVPTLGSVALGAGRGDHRGSLQDEAFTPRFPPPRNFIACDGKNILISPPRADFVAFVPQTRGIAGLAAGGTGCRTSRFCRLRQDFATAGRVAVAAQFVAHGRDSGDDSPLLPR